MRQRHKMKDWIVAARLRTLPLAIACTSMGAFLANFKGHFDWKIYGLLISTTLLLQILSNFANDYGDYVNGADLADRQGPSRMVQSGNISAKQMKMAIILFAALSFISGILLLYVSLASISLSFMLFIFFGIAAIYAAISYTAGSNPYGYVGLGDLSVFIFFGLMAVCGSYFLFSGVVDFLILLPAATCGFLSVGVLNLNNIRDIESDQRAGKMTIPVRIGKAASLRYHASLISLAAVSAFSYVAIEQVDIMGYLFVLTLPLFLYHLRKVYIGAFSTGIDPFLKQLALLTLLFVVVFGIGLALV